MPRILRIHTLRVRQGRCVCAASVCLGIATAISCAGHPRINAMTIVPVDTGLSAALLRTVSDSERLPVHLDPELLPAELDAAGPDVSLTGQRAQVRTARAANIVEAALRSADQGIRTGCAGTAVPVPRDEPDVRHRGCPSSPQVIVVAGRPEVVSRPCVADSTLTDRGALSGACATVRAIVTHLSPAGFNLGLYDFLFERQPRGAWRLVARKWLSGVE